MRRRQAQFYDDLKKSSLEGGLQAMATNALRMAKLTKYLKTFEETFENWNYDKLDQGAIRLTFLAHDRVPGGFPKLLELAQNSIPRDFTGYVSGTIASVVQLANGLVSGMAWGVGVSVVVMWLVCAVLFKSWRLAAVAFFPNAFPIIVVYGYMGLVGSPLSSGSAMVATVSLGMNQTIYILMRYRRMTRTEGYDTATALRETFTHIGRPVVLTSMVFTIGFLIFLLSDFLPLHNFGLLTSIAMLAGLASDIAILPCLLHVFDRTDPR
jgi:predicted RND superfamily exporter protein